MKEYLIKGGKLEERKVIKQKYSIGIVFFVLLAIFLIIIAFRSPYYILSLSIAIVSLLVGVILLRKLFVEISMGKEK